MITLRQRIFIISGVVIAVIAALVLFLLFLKKPQDNNVDNNTNNNNQTQSGNNNVNNNNNANNQIKQITPADPEEVYVRQLSRLFVERFGSFSNQNGNAHIDDVLELATDKMQTWLKKQGQSLSDQYEGVTSEVLSTDIIDLSGGIALVNVGVKQTISKQTDSGLEQTVVQKKGQVELQKVGADWKIDGFYWNEE